MDATKLLFILVVSITSEKVVLSCLYDISKQDQDIGMIIGPCECQNETLLCLGLYQIPYLQQGPSIAVVTRAIFQSGYIATVPNNSLPSNLSDIAFEYNPLTNLTEDSFLNSAETLTRLSITGAKFDRLPVAIEKLKSLSTLIIHQTPIQYWDNITLQSIGTTVRTLSLRRDGLITWPSWLNFFTSLKSLDLSNNDLKSLPDHAFTSLEETLTELTLVNVRLTQLPAALSRLQNLLSLNLSYNKIVSENDRSGLYQLNTFHLATTLSTLVLKSMGLTVLPDLSNLTNLNELNMSSNDIPHITAGHFPVNIKKIIMDSNKLTEITDTSFTNMTNLTELSLRSNPISAITPSAFVFQTGLRDLFLHNTSLKELPQSVPLLVSLEQLVITKTPLQCACPHNAEVVQWFVSYNGTIQGLCIDSRDIVEYLDTPCKLQTTTKGTTTTTTKKIGNGASAFCCSVFCRYACMLVFFLMNVSIV